jgi:hypothetical protein
MIDLNFVPLDVTYRKKLIDLLATVRCNGAQAYTTNFLLGSGPSLPLYTSFAVARSSTTTKLKFYETTANGAKQQLITYDSDFGATNNGLSSSWVSQMRDAALLPVTVFAVVPGRSHTHTRTTAHTLWTTPSRTWLTDQLVATHRIQRTRAARPGTGAGL